MNPISFISTRCRGFTLVEVIVAVGMVTFALVTVVALLPSGLKSHQFATDQARNVQVLNDLTRAVNGVYKEGNVYIFPQPFYKILPSGAKEILLEVGKNPSPPIFWLKTDGTLNKYNDKPEQRELRGAVRIEQLSSPVAGTLPVSISVAWPGTATYQGGKWTKNEGSVSTLQFITLPD